MRALLAHLLICGALGTAGYCCECIGVERPCEYLRSDAVFVGRVIETTAVKHSIDENSYSSGYSMRFAVDDSIRGDLGTETTIETGSGGGDCGTPLSPGGRFLIFAYKNDKDGKLWTGACSGNLFLGGDHDSEQLVEDYHTLVRSGKARIFGTITKTTPNWQGDEVVDSSATPAPGVTVRVESEKLSVATTTDSEGTYNLGALPPGKYRVTPDIATKLDYDHEYEENYEAEISSGECKNVSFQLKPVTRIRGHVAWPEGAKIKMVKVTVVPKSLKLVRQYSGKFDYTDGDGNFDIWPLPAGDYYVGVNINNSPSKELPFPPTYYPGVVNPKAASIVHVDYGEIKDLSLALPEVAKTRKVHFVAIGLDGKPLRKIYVQLEDLRYPGEASSYVNVDLDEKGAGELSIYSGYSYHLHGSHWVSYGNDWCSNAVAIPAGISPVEAKFVMDRKDANCEISDTDKR